MSKNKNLPPFEKRYFDFDVNAEETESGNIIIGRPIVYNSRTNIGPFDEIIEQGALEHTDISDVRFFVNHDLNSIPLARSRATSNTNTMFLFPDSEGMKIKVELDTKNNQRAAELYSAVIRRDITGMSFMFSVDPDNEVWEDIETEHPTRRIKAINTIIEVSAVCFPAYEATEIYARDNFKALENALNALENARSQDKNIKTVETDLRLLKEKTKLLCIGR